MKKDQLIHMHALLLEIKGFMEDNIGSSAVGDKYDSIETRPVDIHLSKDDHKEAVATLLADMSEETNGNIEEMAPKALKE